MQALELLRYYPEEVESDLIDKGLDVADWWNRTRKKNGRLKLSSRKLLVAITGTKETGAFKSAYRDDWGNEEYMWAMVVNEIRILRADNVALHGDGNKMEPVLLKSPKQTEADEEKAAHNQALRGGILAQLHGATRPTTE